MINTLEDYIHASMPGWGDFATNPNLEQKVSREGVLLAYSGNTVVFLLDEDTRAQLRQLQRSLYQAAPEMLANPLQESTFHMTLHDLINGKPEEFGLRKQMDDVRETVIPMLARWKKMPPLRMRTTCLFNMVNTSIVLGLAPADNDSWQRLDELYTALESVVRLGYAMTPHITLAYFRPGIYTQDQVQRINCALGQAEMAVTLQPKDLVLQNFTDMNHYETVI